LVELGRLKLLCPIGRWFRQALGYPGVRILDLTPRIAIESTRLPGKFHFDPADQIIVAAARIHQCPLVTSDSKIAKYGHVKTIA
jgi:PIN domain nuclease of toxin-antitoxin system